MTRKDFELIARTLKISRPKGYEKRDFTDFISLDAQWACLCTAFADALAGTNASFDRARFLKACGYAQ